MSFFSFNIWRYLKIILLKMILRDIQSISNLEASNETFFPSRSDIEIGWTLYFCIFALVRMGESRINEQSYLNRRHAHETRAYSHVQAWTHVDSKSLCRTLSTIEPRRTSNFICHRTNFPSKRIIRVEESGRKSIHFFSRNKNIILFHDKQDHCCSVTTEIYVLRLI